MGDDKNKGSMISISGVLIVLAALGVVMFTQPFKGSRPSVPEIRESYEKINARLWQDPFSAVLDSAKLTEKQLCATNQSGFDINKPLNKQKATTYLSSAFKEKQQITILGVMVPGGPYAEDVETRMRFRYAALSGLSRIGFTPDDEMHIGYISMSNSDTISLSNIIPFEWLTHREKKDDSVLVLWINDGSLRENPLSKLGRLAEYIKLSSDSQSKKIKFKIIGPYQSSTLKEMVKETVSNKDSDTDKEWEIYSATATVDDAIFIKGSDCLESLRSDDCKDITSLFASKHIKLIRTIGSDGALATKLVDEIILRDEDLRDKKTYLKDKKTHFLLVAEWDTFYGQSFEDVFKKALKEKFKDDNFPDNEVDRRVHRISYMRGIDGILPGEKENKDVAGEKGNGKVADQNDLLKNIKNLEQPVGKSQYDYLRRLADETYRLNQNIKKNPKQEEIKVIGVVGTDFYDKYLVLQALRQRFPDAIYFTTDLDARYMHPDHFKWTRNLIVASNFDLSLRKDLNVDIQGEIPPFRDNYQTSVFLAVLKAFNDVTYLDKTVMNAINKPLEPLIFEIGRSNAILLTNTTETETITIHPVKNKTGGNVRLYSKIAVIVLVAFIFFYFASARVNDFVNQLCQLNWTYWIWTAIGIFFTIFVPVYIILISNMPKEEPFSITEGTSVWPTILIRILVIILSIVFLYMSWKDGKKNIEDINREFNFKQVGDSKPLVDKDTKQKWYAAVLNWRKTISPADWKNATRLKFEPENKTLVSFWFEYVHNLSGLRVIINALLYFMLCALIIRFDPPVPPLRGGITFLTHLVTILVSVISFAVLISYVLEATGRCRKFIDIASEKFSEKSDNPEKRQKQIQDQIDLIRLIAKRTETVAKLIFYPLIVWLVMFVAGIDYFDNWVKPLSLVVVISLGAIYTWICAFLLRRSTERARTRVMERLNNLLFEVRYSSQPNKDVIDCIEFMLKEVRDIKQGSFAPFMQHPVVQSLLVPFGGVGGIYLVDFFAKMNI